MTGLSAENKNPERCFTLRLYRWSKDYAGDIFMFAKNLTELRGAVITNLFCNYLDCIICF